MLAEVRDLIGTLCMGCRVTGILGDDKTGGPGLPYIAVQAGKQFLKVENEGGIDG